MSGPQAESARAARAAVVGLASGSSLSSLSIVSSSAIGPPRQASMAGSVTPPAREAPR